MKMMCLAMQSIPERVDCKEPDANRDCGIQGASNGVDRLEVAAGHVLHGQEEEQQLRLEARSRRTGASVTANLVLQWTGSRFEEVDALVQLTTFLAEGDFFESEEGLVIVVEQLDQLGAIVEVFDGNDAFVSAVVITPTGDALNYRPTE